MKNGVAKYYMLVTTFSCLQRRRGFIAFFLFYVTYIRGGRTVLERRQLGWGADVALAKVWAVSNYSDVQCILADSYLPTPCTSRLLTTPEYVLISYFLLEFKTKNCFTVLLNS